ncbi:MAG TPA: hypothetical protein VLC09_17775 [Polyangiaceae bacterium]|nr:hypothetical protein [Polyangiaceae bacterium]
MSVKRSASPQALPFAALALGAALASAAVGCGGSGDGAGDDTDGPTVDVENPLTDPASGPPAGYLEGDCPIPEAAGTEDVTTPTTVVGDGTPESCTSAAFVEAVAGGGIITFDCGEEPHTITLEETAGIRNDSSEKVVIDGAGKITLSGAGARRIIYMNTCAEELGITSDHCDNQEFPQLTVQNLTFIDGNARSFGASLDGGGGAIWARGGRIKIVNSRFFNNVCVEDGHDVAGGAVRAYDQFEKNPIFVVNTTFGGAEELGNRGSNGGGIGSIGVSWTIINSYFAYNVATGSLDVGGSGGGIYNDGNTMTLSLCGTLIEHNEVTSYGQAIFFVSNDHSGTLQLEKSIIRDNVGGSWYPQPGISMHDDTNFIVDDATILE